MIPFLLWILGLVLILIEFYVPGAVMGIFGGVLIVTSVILFATQGYAPWAIAIFLLMVITSVILLIRFALWRIPRAKPDFSIYSDKDQTGYVASGYDQSAIGKQGTVLSDLKPGGYVLIEGKQHQAISQSGYIVKGSKVLVLSGEGESLIVKHIEG